MIDDGEARGFYPELLRSFSQKAGCEFQFTVVPRARQVVMFETGKADLLLPASSTATRDQQGQFVPMVSHRTMLISPGGQECPHYQPERPAGAARTARGRCARI